MTHSAIEIGNTWKRKAKALDQYRSALLREKHKNLGYLFRAGKYFLSDLYLGLIARLQARDAFHSESRTILVLHGTPKMLSLQRKKGLVQELRTLGHTVSEAAIEPLNEAVRQGFLCRPPQKVPLRYYAYAAYAEWLSRNGDPRIILSDRNGSLVTPFLRLSLNSQSKLLAHLAHATTLESSQRLGMIDYDYYFLFGESSLSALRKRKLRFGRTQTVLSGSHLIDNSYDIAEPEEALSNILILGVGPDKEKRQGYINTYKTLIDWVAAHPEINVCFKPHYRSKGSSWHKAAKELKNLSITSADQTLAQALKASSAVVNIMSNAVLEASLARRPVAYVNLSGEQDILEQSSFFGGAIDTLTKLEIRLSWISKNYNEAVLQSVAFSNYHLANGTEGQRKTATLISQLFKSQEIQTGLLEGNFDI